MMGVNAADFGLKNRDVATIYGIFEAFPEVHLVHIFGSRAKGNYKPGSDIDVAIMNEGVNDRTLRELKNSFDESSLPYQVDLVCFTALAQPEFIDHIKRVGRPFYQM